MTRKRAALDSESDYEVVGVSQGNKPGGIVSVRLKPEEMELLVALSKVSGRTLSATMRLGLRCLDEKPAQVTGSRPSSLRLETRGTQAVTELSTHHEEWSQPSAVSLVWTR
ncbi:MAG: hypothetical protein WCP98_16770 [Actinomycetes bacterium]